MFEKLQSAFLPSRVPVGRILYWIRVGLFITILWEVGALSSQVLAYLWLPSTTTVSQKFIPPVSLKKDKNLPFSTFKPILDKNIFDAVRGEVKKGTSKPVAENMGAKLKGLIGKLQLNGVVIWGQYKFAMIEDKTSRSEKKFSIGDEVFGNQMSLIGIEKNKVFLKLGDDVGFLEKVVMKDTVSIVSTPSGKSKTASSIQQQGTDFYIPSAEIEASMKNFSQLVNQARVVPYFENKVHKGYQIRSIDKGSLYDKLGMKNYDIIKQVNGKTISSPEQALSLFQMLRNEREITLQVKRAGKLVNLQYHIQ